MILRAFIPAEAPCKTGNLKELRSFWMIQGDVLGILTTPDQVARAAHEGHCARVEKAVIVSQMVNIATPSTADLASTFVVLPDDRAEELPLVRLKEIVVVHAGIYARHIRFLLRRWA